MDLIVHFVFAHLAKIGGKAEGELNSLPIQVADEF